MKIDVILTPDDLSQTEVRSRSVVIFDVLRATTTMVAALDAGVREIQIFPDKYQASDAARQFSGPGILCGEERCLPPPGFDLGNSPSAFDRSRHAGRTVFMTTTNGCRAVLAAKDAASLFIGALTNASAVAEALIAANRPITLLCAGTDGQIAMEDLLGAGAVIEALQQHATLGGVSDSVPIARRLFQSARADLPGALRESVGGRNILAVGLDLDIDLAARLDSTTVVGIATGDLPVVRRVVQ